VKLSALKRALIKIVSDRNVQLTIAFFGIGFLLALAATITSLEERVESETLEPEDGVKRIEARLDRTYDEEPFLDHQSGLKNATLELRSGEENTNATIILERYGIQIKSWEIEDGEDKNINMTEYHEAEYIVFKVTDGKLSYTYTVSHYIQPYSFLSIPAFILLWVSVIFLIRAMALMGPIRVDEKEKKKFREDQKVIDDILKDRKEEGK